MKHYGRLRLTNVCRSIVYLYMILDYMFAVSHYTVSDFTVLYRAMLCCAEPRCTVLRCLRRAMPCRAVLYCAMMRSTPHYPERTIPYRVAVLHAV